MVNTNSQLYDDAYAEIMEIAFKNLDEEQACLVAYNLGQMSAISGLGNISGVELNEKMHRWSEEAEV